MNSQAFFRIPPYKSFADYVDIQALDGREDQFTATEKAKSRIPDACYDDKWYLLLRATLYRAQVEKAISILYQRLLGYATDIEIIKKNDEYYVASRAISLYTSWLDCQPTISLATDESLLLNGFPIKNLGKIAALTRFFGDDDSAPGNFGVQFLENQKQYRAFKIDSEKSLIFEEDIDDEANENLEIEIKNLSVLFLKKDITELQWFKDEKSEMLDQIARTDFTIIEKILRQTITTSVIESFIDFTKHMKDSAEKSRALTELENMAPDEKKKYEIDGTIEKLREKHLQLRKERNVMLSVI